MPDGDRFKWHLRGKGWRKLYNLLNSGASSELLGEAAGTAVANYLRESADIPFSDFIRSVQDRLARPPLFESMPIHSFGGAVQLSRELEERVGDCSFAEPALLAQRAALRTYAELKGRLSACDAIETASIFAGKLGCEIVERKCLAIVRDEVARQANRSFDEQVTFEQAVISAIEQVSRKLGPAMCEDGRTDKIRAPRRTLKSSTEVLLAQPLPVSTEAR